MISEEYYEIWRERSDLYFKDVLGVDSLEEYQNEKILKPIIDYKMVAIKACHSVGKTWTMARVALWFFGCFRNSIVITTAPTYKQVEKLLWGELRDAHKNSNIPIGGRLLATELKKSEKWYCVGFSPQRTAGDDKGQQGSTFQGYHSDYVMVIFDEATGVSRDIWKMADGLMTSGKIVKFVAIGNPTTRACKFFECFSSLAWKNITLSCFDSPNLIANGFHDKEDLIAEVQYVSSLPEDQRFLHTASYKKPAPHLVSAEWVIEYILEWGTDHPLVVSKVFGDFPDDDDNVMIKMSTVEAAQSRVYEIEEEDVRGIGVDVARQGADKSVITELIGYRQVSKVKKTKQDTMEIAGATIEVINNDNAKRRTIVLVDSTGIGSGVYDALVEAQSEGVIEKEVELLEIHFGSSCVLKTDTDKDEIEKLKARFVNLKSRMFQYLANDMKGHLDIFNEKIYIKELPMIRSKVDSKSKLKIESKDEYKLRTGNHSPDDTDSLVLANFARYVNLSYGKFADLLGTDKSKSVRSKKTRKSRIRPKEY